MKHGQTETPWFLTACTQGFLKNLLKAFWINQSKTTPAKALGIMLNPTTFLKKKHSLLSKISPNKEGHSHLNLAWPHLDIHYGRKKIKISKVNSFLELEISKACLSQSQSWKQPWKWVFNMQSLKLNFRRGNKESRKVFRIKNLKKTTLGSNKINYYNST